MASEENVENEEPPLMVTDEDIGIIYNVPPNQGGLARMASVVQRIRNDFAHARQPEYAEEWQTISEAATFIHLLDKKKLLGECVAHMYFDENNALAVDGEYAREIELLADQSMKKAKPKKATLNIDAKYGDTWSRRDFNKTAAELIRVGMLADAATALAAGVSGARAHFKGRDLDEQANDPQNNAQQVAALQQKRDAAFEKRDGSLIAAGILAPLAILGVYSVRSTENKIKKQSELIEKIEAVRYDETKAIPATTEMLKTINQGLRRRQELNRQMGV